MCNVYTQNFKCLAYRKVFQYAAKCCKNVISFYFLKHSSYKKCSIGDRFYMGKLKQVTCVYTNFQVSRSSGNLLICCSYKQGPIYDIRCVLVLHFAIFSDFHDSITDQPTAGRTDGRTLLHRCEDASKNFKHLGNQELRLL